MNSEFDNDDQISPEGSLNLSSKMPKSIDRMISPMVSNREQINELQTIALKNEILEKKIKTFNRSNTQRGKKNFFSPRRALKHALSASKREKSPQYNFKNALAMSRRISRQVSHLVTSFRQSKKYKQIENLSEFHYRVIGDHSCAKNYNKDELISSEDFLRKISKGLRKTLDISIFSFLLSFLKSQKDKVTSVGILIDKIVPTFNTSHPLRILWDFIILAIAFICFFTYSIEKAFVAEITQAVFFTYLLTFLLYIDVAVSLNTHFYVEGVQINNRKRIFRHYVRSQGIKDIFPLLACSILNFYHSHTLIDLNLCLLPLFSRLYDFGERLKELIIKSDTVEALYSMFILLLKIFLWAHTIACFWHYVGHLSDEKKNWMIEKGINEDKWESRYLNSFYWSVTTMLTVGYGDITPTNWNEMVFNILAMILGCAVFGYTMNRIGEILKDFRKKDVLLKKQMKKIADIMRGKGFPLETQTRVKKYLEFVWTQEQREDPQFEEMVMNKLSSRLRDEIVFLTRAKVLRSVPIFKVFSDETLLSLAGCLKRIRISPEEYLYKKGDYDDLSLYLVEDGKLELVTHMDPTGKISIPWKTYQKGDFIGIQELFTGFERSLDVVAVEFSTIFQLSRKDFISILKRSPLEYEKYCRIKDYDILYNQYNQYDINCNSCGYKNHPINQCKFFSYQPQKLKIIGAHTLKKKAKKFTRKTHFTFNSLFIKQACAKGMSDFHSTYCDDEDFNNLCEQYKNNIPQKDEPSEEEISEDRVNSDQDQLYRHMDQNENDEIPSGNGPTSLSPLLHSNVEKKKKTPTNSETGTFSNSKISNSGHSQTRESLRKKTIMPSQYKVAAVNNNLRADDEALIAAGDQIIFFQDLDKVKSQQIYFTWNNVENVLLKLNRCQGHMRSSISRFKSFKK